ncbi:MAG: BamA/TamA family outer membrane protein [Gemmatimonadetes bacterium]|nr:BamA/TamA family outer membrane protein [Gemmatimonadota bacterium]MYI66103.1 BamA/TamA family outer membrane protein [Gemmatimonadota bacterium]
MKPGACRRQGRGLPPIRPVLLAALCAIGWSTGTQAQTGLNEVASVHFEGNEFFSDAQLRRLVQTRAPSCPPILTITCALGIDWGRSSTRYSRVALVEDAGRLQLYYRAHGFQGATVVPEAVLTADSTVSVTFRIEEGSVYNVGSISFIGDPVPPQLGAAVDLPLGTGDPLQSVLIQQAADTLARRLRDAGYAYADVFINLDLAAESDTASVAYRVELGPMSTIGPVQVNGNRLLEDEVILARLPFREGQRFSEREILEGQRSLYELGLVTRALVERDNPTADTDPVIPIRVQIEEGDLHIVGAEGGFDNSECVNVEGRWASRNFGGGGRTLRLQTRLSNILAGTLQSTPLCPQAGTGDFGRLNWLLSADFNQPSFFTRRMTFAAGLYSERLSRKNVFVRETFGLDFAISRSIVGGSFVNLRFRPQLNRLKAAEVTLCATFLACTPADMDVLSSYTWLSPVGLSFSRDRTDDIVNPTRGYRLLVDLEHASGFTASDYAYLRAFADASVYRRAGPDAVFALRVRAGRIGAVGFAGGLSGEGRFADIVPSQKRFYGGGANSVRGFAQNTLGPRTLSIGVEELLGRLGSGEAPACTPEAVRDLTCDGAALAGSERYQLRPIGGLATLEASAEVRFRLYGDALGGAAFVDVGQVWPSELSLDDLEVSPGIGLRYNTAFGPIRLDIAYSFREQEPLQVVTSQIRPFAPATDDPGDRIDIGAPGGPRELIDWVVSEDLALLRPPVLFGDAPGFSWRRFQLQFSIGQAF